MVAIDATILTLFLRPDSGAPLASDGKRIEHLIQTLSEVHQARVIYSDDADIRTIAKRVGIDVIGVADLQLPPESDQMGFEL